MRQYYGLERKLDYLYLTPQFLVTCPFRPPPPFPLLPADVPVVYLDKELAPNGLDLSFQEVHLIIGILYCVGTVEISPPGIDNLLVTSQGRRSKTSVMG